MGKHPRWKLICHIQATAKWEPGTRQETAGVSVGRTVGHSEQAKVLDVTSYEKVLSSRVTWRGKVSTLGRSVGQGNSCQEMNWRIRLWKGK